MEMNIDRLLIINAANIRANGDDTHTAGTHHSVKVSSGEIYVVAI